MQNVIKKTKQLVYKETFHIEIFVVILVGNGIETHEVLRLNVFYQSILDFCHNVLRF